jgi:DNA-binding transcriptional ArsR family regulator
MSGRTVEERLDEVEQRLDHLEGTHGTIPSGEILGKRVAQRLDKRIADEGLDPQVAPVGDIEQAVVIRTRAGTWVWHEDSITLERVLAADSDAVAKSIAGLAHPVRIAIARALIDGPKESAALLEIAGLNTTGQLYHHLQAMADVGLVERRSRNLWASQNLGAFALMMYAGVALADWRGPDVVDGDVA